MGGGGDVDERETNLGSSRRTLQAEQESEFSAITLSQKDAALRDCKPTFTEVLGHGTV